MYVFKIYSSGAYFIKKGRTQFGLKRTNTNKDGQQRLANWKQIAF